METLVAVRGALKELYVHTNICDVWLESIIHLVNFNCIFMKISELKFWNSVLILSKLSTKTVKNQTILIQKVVVKGNVIYSQTPPSPPS